MKKIFFITNFILISFLQLSCNTDVVSDNVTANNAVDVYVAGQTTEYVSSRALFWKNEKLTFLTPENINARAHEIFVSDNQVFICGEIINSDLSTTAVYWLNGTINIIEQNSVTHDILKNGNDLYITGIDSKNAAVYWKNGVKNVLSSEALASSIMKMKMINNDL